MFSKYINIIDQIVKSFYDEDMLLTVAGFSDTNISKEDYGVILMDGHVFLLPAL
jgi:hypothetical protein